MASSGDIMRGSDFHSSNIAKRVHDSSCTLRYKMGSHDDRVETHIQKGNTHLLKMAFKLTLSP